MGHPRAIFVQLTTACNAKCINCPHSFTYGAKGANKKGSMSSKVWDKILFDIKEMEFGGNVGLYLQHEPLLVPSLYDKISAINRQTNARVVVSTNGSLLNDANRSGLIAAKPFRVHININFADKVQYEYMTGLSFESTIANAMKFIEEARGLFSVEINCPVLPGVDTQKLKDIFPGVLVYDEFWANSRGGLLPGISSKNHGSRFYQDTYCTQPTVNFNILHDGSVVVCCNDWAQESRGVFPNVLESSIYDIYNSFAMVDVQADFKNGIYTRFQMCSKCADELGFDVA
ncbi:radical SAM/SPASM domain-containing protein [Desulfovibrio sp. DV]|uniref:radical SAM/SPASM domain-containing protein n=1 Tax=Desulfovibrio sp. DV TaxID=1844708 RepID=UPI00094B8F2D|nr:radical SAM/SPASM domain-containing protein [Desulfovibrio sp. DV]